MAVAAAFPAYAQNWGQIATISSTLGVNANRLCIGEGTRADIGCPASAPYVSVTTGRIGIGTDTPSTTLHLFSSVSDPYLTLTREIVGTGVYSTALSRNILNFSSNQAFYMMSGTNYLASYHNNSIKFAGPIFIMPGTTTSANFNAPSATLHVSGTARFTSWTAIAANVTPTTELDVYGTVSATNLRLSGNLYVSGSQTIDGVTFANGGVSATGVVTATSFSGDGSGLTNVPSGDRIVSGTTKVIANNGGNIDFMTGNTITGYYTPGGIMTAVGISTTGPISGTHSYFNGSGTFTGGVSVGNNAPAPVTGGIYLDRSNFPFLAYSIAGVGVGQLRAPTSARLAVTNASGATEYLSVMTSGGTAGNVGIGTTTPTATLQVSGSFTVSTSAQTNTPSLYVGANGNLGIGTSLPSTTLHLLSANGLRISHPSSPDGYFTDIVSAYSSSYPFYIGVRNYGRPLGIKGFAGSSFASSVPFMAGYYGLGFATGANDPSTTHLRMVILADGKIGIGTITPTTQLEVLGTVSATNFIGDGSGLTGITAASSDRIVSGTTKVIANNGGNIDFMTGNTITGYYTPGGILAAVGISTSTNQASFTTIYASGNVGIGTASPANLLELNGSLGKFKFTGGGGLGDTYIEDGVRVRFDRNSVAYVVNGNTGASASLRLGVGSATAGDIEILQNGNVGIGTTSPARTLDVSGTAQVVSRTLIGGTGTPSATLQVSGSLLLAGNDNIPCTDSVLGLVRRNPSTGRLQACR